MKKIVFVISILFAGLNAFTQTNVYVKFSDISQLQAIEKVVSGGYITIGRESNSNQNIMVARWDTAFNPLWTYTFVDTTLYPMCKFIEANDGNFYLMMRSNTHIGSVDIVKFSRD
jgi:hypothetical protein